MERNDTIAAIATAPGRAGVAVVRVSGPDAFSVAEKLAGFVPEPGRFRFAKIKDPMARGGRTVDEAIVLSFAHPRSYTGEDVVEIQCHGGSVTPRRVLEACFAAGARLARRGEFTERAFLNGRIDYGQAESVLDLIDAKTERAADEAVEGLGGRRRREARELYDTAVGVSATIEHALDVSEEELPDGFHDSVSSMIADLDARLGDAARRAREGKLLRDGALVVLAGQPNAGKSSLMNALLGESRAIVSARPGTTRDSIEEWLDVGGYPIRLVDTAGIRESGDEIEAEGVRRTEALVSKADVVLLLTPADHSDCGTRLAIECGEPPGGVVDVVSKCDLLADDERRRCGRLMVSAKTGSGLDELRCEIAARLERMAASGDAAQPSPGERDLSAIIEARDILRRFAEAWRGACGQLDLVLAANAVRGAAEKLGALVGATYSEDLLESLFSRFCVGK